MSSLELVERRSRRAFTLVELMISIALALLLILAVNQIFQYTTQAVGAGEAINNAINASTAAQATFNSDLAAMVPPGSGVTDAGSLIISSSQVYSFRNKNDLASQGASPAGAIYPPAAYLDLNGNGIFGESTVNGEIVYPYTYNTRNHRTDVLSFFARDQFNRQTGNDGVFSAVMSSAEAWVWYGHLRLPDNSTAPNGPNFYAPADPSTTYATNPNNSFASQFVLGRVATLLREKSVDNSTGVIYDNTNTSQVFIDRTNAYPTATTPATELEPLSFASASSDANHSYELYQSRYDLAATSISGFRNKLASYLSSSVSSIAPYWYSKMLDGETPTGQQSSRFICNPFLPQPVTAAGLAQTNPYFIPGCSQFIVEFAGDYLQQDNNPTHGSTYGNVTGSGSDGQIDYVVINKGGQKVKQIIWYGLPRNTSGGPGINPLNGDVVPVATWQSAAGGSSLAFEKQPSPSSSTAVTFPPTWFSAPASMPNGAQYICAWGPNDKALRPKLIRITLTVDDPTGRLPDGQTYEYVFPVP